MLRSNAFEVSNNGHSIVYHTNGSGGQRLELYRPAPPRYTVHDLGIILAMRGEM